MSLFFLMTLQALTNNWWLSPPATPASKIWMSISGLERENLFGGADRDRGGAHEI